MLSRWRSGVRVSTAYHFPSVCHYLQAVFGTVTVESNSGTAPTLHHRPPRTVRYTQKITTGRTMVHRMMANTRNAETHPGFCAIRPIMLYLPKRANLPPRYNTPPASPHIALSVWIKAAWQKIGRKRAAKSKRTPANKTISDGKLRG
jgi:hypothetical protein